MGDQNLARQAELPLERLGDGDALFFEGQWYTRGGLADQASRFATGLTGLGVRPGDRLVVVMANCPEVFTTYNGAWRAGAVVTPVIFLVSDQELRAAVADSGAVGVVTTAEFLPKVQAAVAGVDNVRFVVVAGGLPAGQPADEQASDEQPAAGGIQMIDFAELTAAGPGPIVDRDGGDLAALLYTGGTTGRSKGVPLTHANLWWCGWAGHNAADRTGLTSALVPLPLAHAYGLLVTCIGMHATEAGQVILMRWFDAAGWIDLAQRHRVQTTALVPSMIQMLLAQPLEEADLSALVAVSSGASPLADDTRAEFERRVPSALIYEGYGCTESASLISANPLGARRLGSVGLPVPGCEVSIQDDAGQPVAAGEDGEICVRSPGVLSGYWHAPEATEVALAGGWLHTGDIGRMDADGYLYVVDRKKDLIIRGGFNVYPRDVEDVLLTHPAVVQAGVVGRPDPRLGEEVVAFAALRPGATATPEELIEHAKARLSATKYPREVRIVPMLPFTAVGKADRKKLRALVREEA